MPEDDQDRQDDSFWLYDLEIETVIGDRDVVCHHVEGSTFRMEGETLVFDAETRVSLYALSALLPLLPAKQRETSPSDWMTSDAEVACPDPHCGARFLIKRKGKRRFTHAETTGLPDQRGTPYWKKDA